MKKKRRAMMLFLIVWILLSVVPQISSEAAGTFDTKYYPIDSNYCAYPIKCYTSVSKSGITTIVYCTQVKSGLRLMRDTFSKVGKRLSHAEVKLSGNIWGGTFYLGTDGYYYVITGNKDSYKHPETFYLAKLNTDWKICGTLQTQLDPENPEALADAFDAGNSDMIMHGKYLYIHCAVEWGEGCGGSEGHQGSELLVVDTEKMQRVGSNHRVASHSFNQFVRYDDKKNKLMTVVLGDGYPRGIGYSEYDILEDGYVTGTDSKNLYEFFGEIGQNYTGVTIKSFELGESNNLIIGTTIPHYKFKSDKEFNAYSGSNNIYVEMIDHELPLNSLKMMTNYAAGSGYYISDIEVKKINDNRFFLLYGLVNSKELPVYFKE